MISIFLICLFVFISGHKLRIFNGQDRKLDSYLIVNDNKLGVSHIESWNIGSIEDLDLNGTLSISYQSMNLTYKNDNYDLFLIIGDSQLFMYTEFLPDVIRDLEMDQTYIRFFFIGHDISSDPVYIGDQCYQCDYSGQSEISQNGEYNQMSSNDNYKFKLSEDDMIFHFQPRQHSLHTVIFNSNRYIDIIDDKGESVYVSFFALLAANIGFFIAISIAQYLFSNGCTIKKKVDSHREPNNSNINSQGSNTDNTQKTSNNRIASLDVFRGISIAIMIVVNYGGGSYYFVIHKYWNGLYIGDFAFPWFLFISGSSLVLSYSVLRKRTKTNSSMLWFLFVKAIRRSIILFVLGVCIINRTDDLKTARITSVLGYFAITGLFTSLVLMLVPYFNDNTPKQLPSTTNTDVPLLNTTTSTDQDNHIPLANLNDDNNNNATILNVTGNSSPVYFQSLNRIISKWNNSVDLTLFENFVTSHFFEWIVMLIPPLIHFCISEFMSVPNCPRGYRGPGGVGDWGKYPGCCGGAHSYIDYQFLGPDHLYQQYKYGDSVFIDSEGVLGSLNSILLVSLGAILFHIFMAVKNVRRKVLTFFIIGLSLVLYGLLLCGFKENGGYIPINKTLSSLSFVCVVGGAGYIAFTILYLIIDVWKLYGGYPFISMGKNALLLYIFHEVLDSYFPFTWYIGSPNHWRVWLRTLTGTSLWVFVGLYCDKIRFYLKI